MITKKSKLCAKLLSVTRTEGKKMELLWRIQNFLKNAFLIRHNV